MQIPYNWREYIHHGGSSRCRSSIVQSGLIAGGTESKGGRQTVFLHISGSYERTTKRRTLRCEGATRGTLSNEVESAPECSLLDQLEKNAEERGLIFCQANSNAVILDNSVSADCLEKMVNHKTSLILYPKVRLSSRLSP